VSLFLSPAEVDKLLEQCVVIDYETYWTSEYSLSSKKNRMTTQRYIWDERFSAHGAGIKVGFRPSVWVPGPKLPMVFDKLQLHKRPVIGHHLNFDGGITAWRYNTYPKLYIDTLALARSVIGQHSHRFGLENVAQIVLGKGKFPGFLQESRGHTWDMMPQHVRDRLIKYCCGPYEGQYGSDTEMTFDIARLLLPWVPKDELKVQDWTIRIFTDPKVYLDSDMLWQYHNEVKLDKIRHLERAGLDSRDTLMSNEKYANALIHLGVEPPMKMSGPTKTHPNGRMTFAFAKTDPDHKALLEHDDPRVQAIVAARMAVKTTIEETRSLKYAEAADLGVPWPIHLNASGAKNTHRFSGGAGAGGNPQNWTRGGVIRDSVMAPEGKVFVVPDLSQIEARITLWFGAYMPGYNLEWEALETLRKGDDIYSWFGSHLYGMQISKKTHPLERQVSKSGVLGLGFGMGAPRLVIYAHGQNIHNMDLALANRVKEMYRSMFSGVVQGWKACDNILVSLMNGWEHNLPSDEMPLVYASTDYFGSPAITLPGGLQIKYPGLTREGRQWIYMDGNTKVKLFGGKVFENIVQGTAGRILREIILEVQEPGYIDVWTNVHDEAPVLIDIDDEIRNYLEVKAYNEALPKELQKTQWVNNPLPCPPPVQKIKDAMTRDIPYMPGLPLAMEYDFGYRYGDCK
jgi:hypothetical protein